MIHASLFSGIGGPEIAAAMMGWKNAFHCEINPFGRKILEYWFPESVSYEDITKTDFKEWRRKIDILTGGFPCQPFSCAGKRRGQNDARYLWPEMCRAIQEIRPTWVVGENVAGITTMVEGGILTEVGEETALFQEDNIVYGYEFEQPFTIERICSDLEHIGYSVQPMLIPAAAVGAPHRRDRIFILGYIDRGNEELSRENKDVDKNGITANAQHRSSQKRGRLVEVLGTSDKKRKTNGFAHVDVLSDEGLRGNERWRLFPMQPPLLGGMYGFPNKLDSLSISKGKWTIESLKAYGNAIVPQVMFRIFQAIDIANKEK